MNIDNFIRVIHSNGHRDLLSLDDASMYAQVFSIVKSKMSTYLFVEGDSPIDVLDEDPDENTKYFCTAILAYTDLDIYFNAVENNEYYKYEKFYPLHKGDIAAYFGINPSRTKIKTEMPNNEYPFKIFKFIVQKKRPKGNGKNKYKVAITFSDKYEIEIFADSKEEAKKQALDRGFAEWDHSYDYVDYSKIKEYQTQKTRHTVWHPDQIIIEEL